MSENQLMTDSARIKEIFTSIQGEGPYIGVKQLFVRFCGCNLNCKYCDTKYDNENSRLYSIGELQSIIDNNLDCHSVSLTGGEPLLNIEFLKKFVPLCKLPIYLETNATLADSLSEVIDNIDYISADIKIPSCTGGNPLWIEHSKFFNIAQNKNLFAKVVFDENITDSEIAKSVELVDKYGIELVLQPKSSHKSVIVNMNFVESIFNKFLSQYTKVRLIPQVHKFLNLR